MALRVFAVAYGDMAQMVGPYQLIESRPVYRNPWISVREDEVLREDGGRATFGVVEMKPGSSVVALTDEGEVVLVREFKYGVQRETLELVSGAIEEGETPLETARRELREETGFQADEWVDLGVIDPFTTVIRSQNYMFLARGLRAAGKAPDEGEVVETLRVPLAQAVEMVLRSEIRHGASSVALLKAERFLAGKSPGPR